MISVHLVHQSIYLGETTSNCASVPFFSTTPRNEYRDTASTLQKESGIIFEQKAVINFKTEVLAGNWIKVGVVDCFFPLSPPEKFSPYYLRPSLPPAWR